MRAWIACLCLAACDGGKLDGEDSAGGADGGADSASSGDSGGGADPLAPIVLSGTIQCLEGGSGVDSMYVEAQADDPQGVDSLASAGHLLGAYVPDGTEVFNEALVACSPEGLCVGSFRDGDFGAVGCATAADYEFRITIYDEDGNASLPFALSQL